ncbi:ABC transporter permease [Cellulomonas shaoxiangyii]|uniref:ABC transporter permease n=2 Tax=Cellulomonas shaoxiangyii TaxID=2566013 RepID=A0A4P7SQ10_9CELL|nr:ABC transporter permease [Cellulomonas shaoxiangyii]TGY86307.1 ABC transporter permease [Cellulomonas shaoxiangyii]
MALTLWVVVTVTFFLMHLLPGSPYVDLHKLTPEQIAILDARAGLDRPLLEQYVLYVRNLLTGDLGVSFQFKNQPVTALLAGRIGPSVQLGLQALVVGTVLGVVLGVVAAVRRGTWLDGGSTVLAVIGRSVPSFVLAAVLQYVLALRLGLFPIAGWRDLSSTVLPTLALAMAPLADSARFVRTEMVEVLASDQAELARAKGLGPWQVAWRHGVRNSVVPLITLLGPMSVALLTGSLVVENIFAVPGIGEQFVKSVLANDYPTIMAVTILYSALLLVVVLVVDVLYSLVDPRIRLGGEVRR